MAEGNSEMPCGYDEDFVNPIDEDLQCSICYVALREPVLIRCGHRFCKECLERHMARYVEHIILLSYFATWLLKKIAQESEGVKKALLGQGFHFCLWGVNMDIGLSIVTSYSFESCL